MKDLKPLFRELEDRLRQSKWFSDEWQIYNRGVYLHLYKDGWFNENQGGIHFETYVEAPQIRDRTVPIHFHVEEDFPAQEEFISRLLEQTHDQLCTWKGYEIVGRGYTVCQRTLPLDTRTFVMRVLEELNRLRTLAPTIDATIAEVTQRQ